MSAETHARLLELEDQRSAYPSPDVLPPSLSRKREDGFDVSPIIPLSPDPFGRFSSAEVASTPDGSRDSQYYVTDRSSFATYPRPPERTSSLAPHAELEQQDRERERSESQAPSSRFSADSETVEEVSMRNTKDRSTLMSVKSIRKLWRKSNKTSISLPPSTSGGKSSPAIPEAEYERSREPSPVPPVPPPKSPKTQQAAAGQRTSKHGRSESGLDPFYFDQESRYPVRRSPSPQDVSLPASRSVTPSAASYLASPGLPQGTPASTPPLPPTNEKNGSVRKSILKSWKSASSSNPNPNATNGELTPARKRRPSVLDVASSIMRGSLTSNDLASPAVPELPVEYRASQRQSRSSTQLLNEDRQQRRKPAPSSSSDSNSSPPLRTPLTGSTVTLVMTSPRASEDTSRPSFDTVSQFEMVSPKLNSYGLESTLSYPYHGLDAQDQDE